MAPRATARRKATEPKALTLAEALSAAPRVASRGRASKLVSEWMDELSATAGGRTLQSRIEGASAVKALVTRLADHSPYLWDLVTADPKRTLALLDCVPDKHLPALLTHATRAVARSKDQDAVMRILRRMKQEAALLIALADIGGVWPLLTTTRAITELADTAVGAALNFLLRQAVARGELKKANADAPEIGSGHIVVAMGKMGAHELNYSSDIDLIVFYDPDAPALRDPDNAAAVHIRIARGMVKLLQERTADGYVFRVDLRLRPDPASTQIAVSTAMAMDYYAGRGQNWERAAFIKARVCAGDITAGEALLTQLLPFVWRKYLDYAAIADIRALKRQIHAYRGHDEIAVEGHNIKLGRGGIREVEFFVQTQQLVAGGRHPELRGRETLPMLEGLAAEGWIDAEAVAELRDAYLFLRMVEHRLQMVADEQTHTLPADRDAMERFARFCGFKDREAFAATLTDHLRRVQARYVRLFEDRAKEGGGRELAFPAAADDRETLNQLAELGYRKPLQASAMVRALLHGEHPALRSAFARSQLAELMPTLIEQLSRTSEPDAALATFDTFIRGIRHGGQLFSMLRQNPDLIGVVALILGSAPRLASVLAMHPEAMDSFLEPSFFGALPSQDTLEAELKESLDQSQGYEDTLDRLRIFSHEQLFLIGGRILSGTVSATQAGEAFARVADTVVRALHREVERQFEEQFGRIRGQQTVLLSMGKLGGREMTAGSDLDLILIYDHDSEQPQSDGARPLYGAQYFARLTQRLVSALTAPTNYGALYQVDMRLRPSGRAGPLATSLEAFTAYQKDEAWTWEHMALTRARVVSGSPLLARKVERAIRAVLRRPRDQAKIAAEVAAMRETIARDKGEQDRWDLKVAAGGLVDVEFIAQHLQLVHAAAQPDILDVSTVQVLERARQLRLIAPEQAETLLAAARLYHNLTQVLRLCLPGPLQPDQASEGLRRLLCVAADLPDFATLDAHLIETQREVRALFRALVG